MLHRTIKKEEQSRRHVQRRFPPGSFLIDSRGTRMAFIVGWGPTPTITKLRRPWDPFSEERVVTPRGWIAYVIEENRILTVPWERVRDGYNLEEWEALSGEAGS